MKSLNKLQMLERPQIRQLFHWKFSGVLIPTLWGAGLSLALANKYELAYVFFALFGLWLVSFWLTSEFVLKHKRRYENQRQQNAEKRTPSERRQGKERRLRRKWLLWKWGMTSLWLAICVICFLWMKVEKLQYELHQLQGVLYPASDPTPATACRDIPPDATVIIFGNSAAYTQERTNVLLREGPTPLLWLTTAPDGAALLNGTFRSIDGRVIAEVSQGRFSVNPNATLPFSRPDRSTLVVRDEYGNVVLNVRYINKHAISLLGKYQLSRSQAFIIEREEQSLGGVRMSHGCFGNNGAAIGIGP